MRRSRAKRRNRLPQNRVRGSETGGSAASAAGPRIPFGSSGLSVGRPQLRFERRAASASICEQPSRILAEHQALSLEAELELPYLLDAFGLICPRGIGAEEHVLGRDVEIEFHARAVA